MTTDKIKKLENIKYYHRLNNIFNKWLIDNQNLLNDICIQLNEIKI